MADFNNPQGTSGWLSMVSQIRDLFAAVANGFQGGGSHSNVPTNAKRIDNDGSVYYWDSAAWQSIGSISTGSVDDTAYGVSWDGSTTLAPSQNAVYDKIDSLEGMDVYHIAPTSSGDGSGRDASNKMSCTDTDDNVNWGSGNRIYLTLTSMTSTDVLRVPHELNSVRLLIGAPLQTFKITPYNGVATSSLDWYQCDVCLVSPKTVYNSDGIIFEPSGTGSCTFYDCRLMYDKITIKTGASIVLYNSNLHCNFLADGSMTVSNSTARVTGNNNSGSPTSVNLRSMSRFRMGTLYGTCSSEEDSVFQYDVLGGGTSVPTTATGGVQREV